MLKPSQRGAGGIWLWKVEDVLWVDFRGLETPMRGLRDVRARVPSLGECGGGDTLAKGLRSFAAKPGTEFPYTGTSDRGC